MGNTITQKIDNTTGTGTGTGVKTYTCTDIQSADKCNNNPNCIFLNGCNFLKTQNYENINSIPVTNILSGIIDVTLENTNEKKYKLFLMINNNFNNILLKGIVINFLINSKCNNNNNFFPNKYYLYPDCNLFISNESTEFQLKSSNILHTFNKLTSEIDPPVFINQEQLDIIKENDYKIKLIDIYSNELIIPILNYPTADETQKIMFDSSFQRLNKENIYNTGENIKNSDIDINNSQLM